MVVVIHVMLTAVMIGRTAVGVQVVAVEMARLGQKSGILRLRRVGRIGGGHNRGQGRSRCGSLARQSVEVVPLLFAAEPDAVDALQLVGAIGRMGDSYRAVGIADELVVARLAVIVDLIVVAFALIDVVALATIEGVATLGADEAVRAVGAGDIAAGRIDDVEVAIGSAAIARLSASTPSMRVPVTTVPKPASTRRGRSSTGLTTWQLCARPWDRTSSC